MADGTTHAYGSLVASAVAAASIYLYTSEVQLAAAAAVGGLAGIALTPDLDQESISAFEWKLIRVTFGLGFIWLAFWGPYSILIPHRSFISHGPLISTGLRLLYVYVMGSLLGRILNLPIQATLLSMAHSFLFIPFVVGLVLSDLSHAILDIRWFSAIR